MGIKEYCKFISLVALAAMCGLLFMALRMFKPSTGITISAATELRQSLEYSDPINNVEEEEGVRLSLHVEKRLYRPGDKVKVTAIAENLNKTPVVCWKANLEDPPIYTFVETPFFGHHSLRNPADPEIVRPAVGSETLEPGGKLVREVSWDLMLPPGLRGPVPAPPGQYFIQAVLNLRRNYSSEKKDSLRVIATVTLEGSKPIISMREALESAIQDTKVSKWFEALGGSFVFRSYTDKKYYRLNEGKLQELAPASNEGNNSGSGSEAAANCAIHLEPGPAWRLFMAGEESEMSVLMDATNGKIRKVESKVYR
jgi:hypothetical protein